MLEVEKWKVVDFLNRLGSEQAMRHVRALTIVPLAHKNLDVGLRMTMPRLSLPLPFTERFALISHAIGEDGVWISTACMHWLQSMYRKTKKGGGHISRINCLGMISSTNCGI